MVSCYFAVYFNLILGWWALKPLSSINISGDYACQSNRWSQKYGGRSWLARRTGASTSQMDRGQKRSYDEMLDGDEPLELNGALQANPSEKRSYEEMLDGDEPLQVGHGQDDERLFNIESVTQVNIKKFRTTGINYRVRFTNNIIIILIHFYSAISRSSMALYKVSKNLWIVIFTSIKFTIC